ncbi:MAG TPA: hypothetical protein VF112_03430, partial [Candidatus Dormibacteraeota bacterium]
MTAVGAAAPVAAPTSGIRRLDALPPPLGVLLAAAVVALPLAWAAAALGASHPDVVVGDDRGLAELALMRATHHAQLLGPYSRFGWHHPGPSWFYLLALPYLVTGTATYGMYLGTLLLQGAAAAWTVLAVRRHGGAALCLATALVLLLYLRALDPQLLRFPWNPLATMLPMTLLLVLCARAAAGSVPALAGALLAGSFLAQTHVSTAPVALAVVAVAAAALLVRTGLPWRHLPASRAGRGLTVAALVALVAMWAPPVIDELTGHPGNLSELVRFLRCGCNPPHPLHEALSAAAQMLAGLVHGNLPVVAGIDPGFGRRRLLVLGGFTIAAVALCAAGRLRGDRFAEATGGLLVVALAVAVWSFTRIAGPIEGYLVIWVTAFAAVLAIGWASLLTGALPAAARRLAPRPRLGAAAALAVPVAVVLCVLSAVRTQGLLGLPSPAAEPGDVQIGYAGAWRVTESALGGVPRQPVLVRIATHELWGTAA